MTAPVFRLAALALCCCPVAHAWPDKPAAIKDGTVNGVLGKQLDAQVEKLAKKGFSGAVLVVKKGEVLLAKGYGLADRDKKVAYTTDTVFDIGSITKQFTGAAIVHLESKGKLSVDDAITKYFKDVPDDKKSITLHHLLTHTAGFPDAIGKDYEKVDRAEFVKLALRTKLRSSPGKTYRYSNVGYSLLAAIVEQTSGVGYEKYLHDNLFAPAGLTKTGYLLPKWGKTDLAHGYLKDGKDWGTPRDHAWADDGPYWHLRGNGGLLATVGDLYHWHVALVGDKVLSKEAKKKYQAPHVKEALDDSHYGYGWVVAKTRRGTTVLEHNGGNGVFYADCHRYVDDDVVIILATNTWDRAHLGLCGQLARTVFTAEK